MRGTEPEAAVIQCIVFEWTSVRWDDGEENTHYKQESDSVINIITRQVQHRALSQQWISLPGLVASPSSQVLCCHHGEWLPHLAKFTLNTKMRESIRRVDNMRFLNLSSSNFKLLSPKVRLCVCDVELVQIDVSVCRLMPYERGLGHQSHEVD